MDRRDGGGMWDIDRLLANLPCTNKAPPLFSETLAEPFSSLVVEVDDGVLYPHKMAILGKSSLAKRRNFLRKEGNDSEIWIKF